jgi:formylglycine-generating enzyme required for sulfatase activity
VASVSGSQITIVGAGSSLITATQTAAGNYLSASTNATFTVTPAVPKLGTFVIPTKPYGSASFSLTPPTSTSSGSWSYSSGNTAVATVSGSNVTMTGVGSTTITATQAATRNYTSASKSAVFKVTPGKPVLGPFVIPVQYLGNGSFTLTPPQSSSTGSWSYASSKPKVATVIGSTVTLLGAGSTTIIAKQAALANYLAASTNAVLLVTTSAPVPPPIPVVTTDTFGTGSNQFTIDFVGIGNPGNSYDTTGYGGVAYAYRIGKYTISQNQIDAATRNGLQNVTAGAWSGDQPAANISWYEAAAYVNWLNTSQGYQPAYNLTFTNGSWSMALWPTTPDSTGNVAWTNGGTNLYRNANCVYFLPSENEWYKAAYYDPAKNGGSGGYWLYPTGSDSAPTPVASGTNSGTAVYDQLYYNGSGPASVFQAGGLSPYGTMGQGGNLWQWAETPWRTSNSDTQGARVFRGGGWYNSAGDLLSAYRYYNYGSFPDYEADGFGFRVARKATLPPPPITSPTTDTFGSGANQFKIDFVGIGNPGNSNDTTGYGGVPYTYRIGKYTISRNQFDTAVHNGLQNVSADASGGDQPAAWISWYEAATYVNWLNTSKGYRPAYNFTLTNGSWSMALWPTTPDSNGNVAWTSGGTNLYRNANCVYFLPSENEWYKAAYYDPAKNGGAGGYWLYPTGSDTAPTPVASGTAAGTAVYSLSWRGIGFASVFDSGGLSPYGTMGQGGNIFQWLETSRDGLNNDPQKARCFRGGYCYDGLPNYLQSLVRNYHFGSDYGPGDEVYGYIGIRVARKP